MQIDDSWYVRPKDVKERVSAGGVVVRLDGDQILVLVARERGRPGGYLPKGGIKKGETLEEAAKREIEEEAGVSDLTLLDSLGTLERLNFRRTRWVKTHLFLFITSQIDAVPTEPDRHDRPLWCPIRDVSIIIWPEQRRLIEKNRRMIVEAAKSACDEARA